MNHAVILECLEQKKALFAKYEECTAQMQVCNLEDLKHYITERAGLANEIDKLNKEINAVCDSDDNSDVLWDAITNTIDYGDLPQEMRPIYDKSAEVFTLINHVYNMEPQVKTRMKEEQTRLLGKIRENSGTAKVYHYVKNLASTPQTGTYLGQKKV